MRTTLNIPEGLIKEAQRITHCQTKTETILIALSDLIRKTKIRRLKDFRGKIKMSVDMDTLRQR